MITMTREGLDYSKLANVLFGKTAPFTVEEIVQDLEIEDLDVRVLKSAFNVLKENGFLIQEGSLFSLKR